MQKVVVVLVCCILFAVSFCFAAGQKKVDNPTIEMLQGSWEGKFTRSMTGKQSSVSGQFDMKIKGKKALISRGAAANDPITQWYVTIDKIDKSKIFMSHPNSDFELELFTNEKGEYFIEGDYTGRKAGSGRSVNSTIKLQRTNATAELTKMPAGEAKE